MEKPALQSLVKELREIRSEDCPAETCKTLENTIKTYLNIKGNIIPTESISDVMMLDPEQTGGIDGARLMEILEVLPEGWSKGRDEETNREYYFHTDGRSSWEIPTQGGGRYNRQKKGRKSKRRHAKRRQSRRQNRH